MLNWVSSVLSELFCWGGVVNRFWNKLREFVFVSLSAFPELFEFLFRGFLFYESWFYLDFNCRFVDLDIFIDISLLAVLKVLLFDWLVERFLILRLVQWNFLLKNYVWLLMLMISSEIDSINFFIFFIIFSNDFNRIDPFVNR